MTRRRAAPRAAAAGALPGFRGVRLMLRRAGLDEATVGAYFRAVSAFAPRGGVTGVDLGVKLVGGLPDPGRGPAVRVHVRDKRPRRDVPRAELVPRRFEGLATDVVQGEYVRQLGAGVAAVADRHARAETLRPGLSISQAGGSFGTLGMFVRGRAGADAGALYLLSADHVLAERASSAPGDAVIQPGADHGGTPLDAVGTLARRTRTFDAAVARLAGARGVANAAVETHALIAGSDFPAYGQLLEKSGARTGVTQALVGGIGFFAGLGGGMHLIPLAPDVDDVPLSDGGDSGAVWYDPETSRAVGLHVRGNAVPTPAEQYAVATSVELLCGQLRVEPAL